MQTSVFWEMENIFKANFGYNIMRVHTMFMHPKSVVEYKKGAALPLLLFLMNHLKAALNHILCIVRNASPSALEVN